MTWPAPFFAAGEHAAVHLPGARAVFTTRRGGVSSGPYAALNLGAFTDDEPDAVRENLARVAAQFDVRPVWGRQVHGARVARADPTSPAGDQGDEADGRATATAGVAPAAMTADCLAVAVAGGGAVAMLHAGWRGLAEGVLANGVREVLALRSEAFSGEMRLEAAIGPHARACCYEVGEEVHALFAGYPGARYGTHLDMAAIARAQLSEAGVAAVHDIGACTICGDPELFYSHRRDAGTTGRQAGLAWLS